MGWSFAYEGHVYRDVDVTLDQWDEICDELDGKSWLLVNPMMYPKDAKQIFRVLVADHTGIDRAAALKVVGAMSSEDYVAMFDEPEDDLPDEYENGIPPQGGDPMTSGSSGAPNGSGGPLT